MKFYIVWDGIGKEIKMPIKAEYIHEALKIHSEIISNDTLGRDFKLLMINKNGLPSILG